MRFAPETTKPELCPSDAGGNILFILILIFIMRLNFACSTVLKSKL